MILCSLTAIAAERKPLIAPSPPVAVVLDTDIGGYMDDAFVLGLILTSPELELRGVTTVDGDAYTRAQLVCNLLHALNRSHIPVAAGSPPQPKPDYEGQMQYGLRPPYTRPVKQLAVQFLYEKLKARPGELTLICIGPLTNIAALLEKHPEAGQWIKRLVIMGGSIKVGYEGKPGPVAEWNIRQDIKAAQRVFASGLPIVLVPLDATANLKVSESLQKEIFASQTLLTNHLQSLSQLAQQETHVLHDPLAVAVVCQEALCTWEEASISVDERGMTRAGEGRPNCRAAVGTRPAEFLKLFAQRLTRPVLTLTEWSRKPLIQVTADDSILIQGNRVSAAQLETLLQDAPTKGRELVDVHISGDEKTSTQTVQSVIKACQNASFANFSLSLARIIVPARTASHGNFPHRVHVVENYETDIERRWWLSGKLETKNVPEGSRRACRAVLCRDFDDRQGDKWAIYKAVIFNPVPGPPMGKNTRLTFRYHLQRTDSIRVQIYSLSNGYHRQLTVSGLPQERWETATVDMTQARRPDGSGGPLSENERIDDIQFYVDPAAELLIDDIVLYDAAAPDEKRPFPKHIHFTGWFDTGKQGAEWPGEFKIVELKPTPPLTKGGQGEFWKAAQSVPTPDGKAPWICVNLRGPRPISTNTRLRFRYHVKNSERITAELRLKGGKNSPEAFVPVGALDTWSEMELNFAELLKTVAARANKPRDRFEVTDVVFRVLPGGELLVDDVLLYEPGYAAGKPSK